MARETVDETEEQREKALEMQKKYGVGTFKGFPFLLPENLRRLKEQIEREKLENQKVIEESVKHGQIEHLEDMIENRQRFHVQETVLLMYADFMKAIHETFYPRIEKLTEDLRNAIGYVSEKASYYTENISECVSREQMLELKKVFVQELKQELASEQERIEAMRESEEFKQGITKVPKKKRK